MAQRSLKEISSALMFASLDGTENYMTIGTLALIILIVLLIGALPTWPYSRSWGYWPGSFLGVVVAVILVLLLMGRI